MGLGETEGEERCEGSSLEDRSGFGTLTSGESLGCLVQPGNGVQVGEVGSSFIPSSVPRDRAISVLAGLGLSGRDL